VMSYDPDARRDTPLAQKLKARIRRDGPITVADYMRACLQDPEHGYYVKQPAIGRAGDFITAPEISQVFGELIGLWCGIVWQQMGAPEAVGLVELGPGRGTLMHDALRAARLVPGFREASSVHLVETNQHLEALQRATLGDAGRPPIWHRAPDTIPAGPILVVANEFLDTFAVVQEVLQADVWCPRVVGVDDQNRLVFQALGGEGLESERVPSAEKAIIRERQSFVSVVEDLAGRAGDAPVAALFVDYGHVKTAPGETLQAVRHHVAEHPLCSPGEADLTAQVDFAAFQRQCEEVGLAVDGPLAQGEFLGRLGIVERASRLMSANPSKAHEIEMGVARLIAPQGMGSRFKAVGVRSQSLPVLPGFE